MRSLPYTPEHKWTYQHDAVVYEHPDRGYLKLRLDAPRNLLLVVVATLPRSLAFGYAFHRINAFKWLQAVMAAYFAKNTARHAGIEGHVELVRVHWRHSGVRVGRSRTPFVHVLIMIVG